jgi:hypothetical protein
VPVKILVSASDRLRRPLIRERATTLVLEDLRWHHDYLVSHLSDDQVQALRRVAEGKALTNLPPMEARVVMDYLRKTGDTCEANSEVFRQFLLHLPDEKPSGEGGVLSGIKNLAQTAMDTAIKKAIEVAADKFLT